MNKFLMTFLTLGLLACGGGDLQNEQDLIEYGVPLVIYAPDSISVKRSSIGFQEDITIDGGENFSIQLFASDAISSDVSKAVNSSKELVQSNRYFDSFVLEEDQGFVFKNVIDSSNVAYGFRYIVVKGGKEYVFQEAMVSSFDEEQAKSMYEAVKGPAKK